jgi:triosephosphate isomerase
MFTPVLSLPIFVVNFKSYVWGREALKLARKMEEIAQESSVYLCAIPQIVDISLIAKETKVPVFSPHLDSLTPGRGTGRVLPEAVKEAGAVGVLLNHSEYNLPLDVISKTMKRAREVGLISMVASNSPQEAEAIAVLGPEVIISEPSSRIGTLRSVGRDKEFVLQLIKRVKNVNPKIIVLCGAGVSSRKDVEALVELGVEGTGASRAIFEAEAPARILAEMVEGLESKWRIQSRGKQI